MSDNNISNISNNLDQCSAGAAAAASEQGQKDGSKGTEDPFDEDLLPASCLFYGVRGAPNMFRQCCGSVGS
jgi:hypothetical protein